VTYRGTVAGADVIQVWLDTNGDGTPSPGEPQTTATVTWTAPTGAAYVAFGDSITTGASVPNCEEDRNASPWGCTVTSATPYPDRVATALGYSFTDDATKYKSVAPAPPGTDLFRVGIWGYTAQEAAQAAKDGKDAQGPWLPELTAVQGANKLVTGALGVNDIKFSDVVKWLKLYLQPGDKVTPEVQRILAERSGDFDSLFNALDVAKKRGAKVIVTLYYNPFDTSVRGCGDLKNLSDTIVNVLDGELSKRATAGGLQAADFRPAFRSHGSGSKDSYVFGTQCKATSAVVDFLPKWLGGGGGKAAVDKGFDPHPNDSGTKAMSGVVVETVAK